MYFVFILLLLLLVCLVFYYCHFTIIITIIKIITVDPVDPVLIPWRRFAPLGGVNERVEKRERNLRSFREPLRVCRVLNDRMFARADSFASENCLRRLENFQ